MNKLLGAMVLLFGITSVVFTGSGAADIDKIVKDKTTAVSHLQQISDLDDDQLSQLCAEIANPTTKENQLKEALFQQCRIKLEDENGEIAEEINKLIESK